MRTRVRPEEKESLMKRLHVHVGVHDLDRSIQFYSNLFAAEPTVTKSDYAKWRLDDPRVNFAISQRGREAGLAHLGIEVDSREELGEAYARLRKADTPVLEEGPVTCCYARSEKAWVTDPAGIPWETFFTSGAGAATSSFGGGGVSAGCSFLHPVMNSVAAASATTDKRMR